MRYGPSVNFVQDTLVACVYRMCDKLQDKAWVKMADTIHERKDHTGEVIADSLFLIGGSGYPGPGSTELMKVTGGSVAGFDLDPSLAYHCSVKLNANTIVVSGGVKRESLVREYSGIGGQVRTRALPDMLTRRRNHACGQYTTGETQVMAALGPCWSLAQSVTDCYCSDDHCGGRV